MGNSSRSSFPSSHKKVDKCMLCSLAQILKQVPTAEMQTVSRESAYPAGLWLTPPLSTPPQRLNSKDWLARMSHQKPRGLHGWAKPQPARVHTSRHQG